MDKAKVKLIALLATGLSLILSCSSGKKITADNYLGYSEIEAGDTANISWQFNNADYVMFESIAKNPVDSIFVSPISDAEYLINAVSRFDTLSVIWKVAVNQREKDTDSESKIEDIGVNFTETKYLSGIDKSASPTIPVPERIKILGYEQDNDKTLFRYVVLDRFGNLIQDYVKHPFSLKMEKDCSEEGIDLSSLGSDVPSHAYTIILDDSFDKENLSQHLAESFQLEKLPVKRDIELHFNSQDTPQELSENFDFEVFNNENTALNNNYAKLFKYIIDAPGNTTIINIVYQNDNCSLIYTPDDIVIAANSTGIRIYTISIGNSIDPLPYRYISHQTGGRYYSSESPQETRTIIYEIILGNSVGFTSSADISLLEDCNSKKLNFDLENEVSDIKTDYSYYDSKVKFASDNQILALFDDKSTEIDSVYYQNIGKLYNVMQDNPGYSIELIGHSAIEGNSDIISQLALDRARSVANELMEMGLDSNRIKLKSMARGKPIYPLESTENQRSYNRRVEVRWLTPFTLPYEIYVGQEDSEDSAREQLETWEKRGYRVYFDRFMVNNNPVYKIILWGYRNKEEAEVASRQIMKLYSIDAEIY